MLIISRNTVAVADRFLNIEKEISLMQSSAKHPIANDSQNHMKTLQKRYKNVRLYNDYRPTADGQLEGQQSFNRCGFNGAIFPLPAKVIVSKGHTLKNF